MKIDVENQVVEVMGMVDPLTLVKKLFKSGKHAEVWSPELPKLIIDGSSNNEMLLLKNEPGQKLTAKQNVNGMYMNQDREMNQTNPLMNLAGFQGDGAGSVGFGGQEHSMIHNIPLSRLQGYEYHHLPPMMSPNRHRDMNLYVPEQINHNNMNAKINDNLHMHHPQMMMNYQSHPIPSYNSQYCFY